MSDQSDCPPEPALPRTGDAVIVVHGVADQQPGETARAFIEMMVAAAPNGARYTAGDAESFTLPVPPMPFRFPGESNGPAADAELRLKATPTARDRGPWKALLQSIKSDFHRPAADPAASGGDRGLAFTRYLLCKAQRNGAPDGHYTSHRTPLTRQAAGGGPAQAIDVYEMYWADQSRLASAVPRIVTELFTMFFRLSRLARDTVDEARRHAEAQGGARGFFWRWLSRLQTLIDWGFTNLLAQLFFQLLLVGLFLIVLGAVMPDPGQDGKTTGLALLRLQYIGWGIVAAGLLAVCYFITAPRRLAAALACAAIGGLMVRAPAAGFGVAMLAVLSVAYLATLRWADDRFPFMFFSGRILWLGIIGTTLWRVYGKTGPSSDWVPLLNAGLSAFEFILFAIKWWFIVFGLVIAVWALLSAGLSMWARVAKAWPPRGSAATGRLGTLVSLASFLLVAMALWAALGQGLDLALKGDCHTPTLAWTGDLTPAAAASAAAAGDAAASASGRPYTGLRPCAITPASHSFDAASFAQQRFRNSTETFALNALLLAAVMGYVLLMLVPSLLAELQLVSSGSAREAARLGRWLTWFYRHLDHLVLVATTAGAAAVVWVVVSFVRDQPPVQIVGLSEASGTILRWFVVPAASALAVLSVLGGIISRLAPGLRAPLDAALDVDNYMREFPRRAIPRARIFARYTALLAALSQQRYRRIVVVAHSQGTVISAELLRYLSSRSTDDGQTCRARRLQRLLDCDSLRLLTLGCPLRQLYAARFPNLYGWVLNQEAQPNGPCADDVGADRWFNAFGSGDYVGRWLWSRHADVFHPLNDVLHEPTLGRRLTYDDFDPHPPTAGTLRTRNELETCIGFAAHTHYFDPPHKAGATPTVALLVDELIAGDGAPGAAP